MKEIKQFEFISNDDGNYYFNVDGELLRFSEKDFDIFDEDVLFLNRISLHTDDGTTLTNQFDITTYPIDENTKVIPWRFIAKLESICQ